MDKAELEQLLTLYRRATQEELAHIIRQASGETTRGLEALVLESPEDYQNIVPQIFDPQTRLYTKTWFEGVKLKDAIKKSETNGIALSYILFDLDDFKSFNDMYGHLMGDRVIELFVNLLRESFRDSERRKISAHVKTDYRKDVRRSEVRDPDIMGRFPDGEVPQGRVGYGEEFGVILYNCDEENARKRVEVVIEKVRRIQIPFLDENVGFTVSAGVAQYQSGMIPKQLIANADKALMYSKGNGKDRVTSFSQIPDFNFVTSPNLSS